MERILIMDDDEAIRTFYAEELRDDGYEVIPLGDASTLIQRIEESSPDLILLDIKLGEYNGLDILQDIRDINNNIPVILCTSYPIFKYDLRSISANYYVVKSSNLDELKLIIKIALKGDEQFLSGRGIKQLQQLFFLDDKISASKLSPSPN